MGFLTPLKQITLEKVHPDVVIFPSRAPEKKDSKKIFNQEFREGTVDGQNPAPPRMMIIPLLIGF